MAIEIFSTNESYFDTHNKKSDIDDLRSKCRFFLAGSKANSVKNKAFGAATRATESVGNALKDTAFGSFWEGLKK